MEQQDQFYLAFMPELKLRDPGAAIYAMTSSGSKQSPQLGKVSQK
jgi:hypothetical protein